VRKRRINPIYGFSDGTLWQPVNRGAAGVLSRRKPKGKKAGKVAPVATSGVRKRRRTVALVPLDAAHGPDRAKAYVVKRSGPASTVDRARKVRR